MGAYHVDPRVLDEVTQDEGSHDRVIQRPEDRQELREQIDRRHQPHDPDRERDLGASRDGGIAE
jgi:hypothetical protein